MWKKLCRALQLSRERRRNTSEVEETWESKRQIAMLSFCLSQHFAMNGCWGFHGNNIAASLVGREIFCIFSWCIIRLFLLSIHTWTRPNAGTFVWGGGGGGGWGLCEACHLYTTSGTSKKHCFLSGPIGCPAQTHNIQVHTSSTLNFYFVGLRIWIMWVIVDHLFYIKKSGQWHDVHCYVQILVRIYSIIC